MARSHELRQLDSLEQISFYYNYMSHAIHAWMQTVSILRSEEELGLITHVNKMSQMAAKTNPYKDV